MSEMPNALPPGETQHALNYASPLNAPRQRWKQRLTVYSVLALACAGAVLVVLPVLGTARCNCGRTQSGANLHQLIGTLIMYANEHQGALPSGWEDLEQQNYFSSVTLRKILIDPATSDRPLPAEAGIDSLYRLGRPEQYLTAKTRPSLNVSYVYAGKGLNLHSATRETIVIYEPPSSLTSGDQSWLAYVDGSVKLVSAPTAEKMIAELQSGHNPPRPEMLK